MRDLLYKLATDEYRGFWAGLAKALLFILSLIYGLIIRVLILLRSQRRVSLGCKVISVGNITFGGTGKTALVESIARRLMQQGHKVAVLSRGYKDADEPFMLKKRLQGVTVIADPDRVRAARKAIGEYAVNTIILDDGFQQWHIKKDLEIVAIDATDPFGNRNMLPRGILRQPLSSLKKADIFLLTKVNLNPDVEDVKYLLAEINPNAPVFESGHIPAGFYRVNSAGEFLSLDALKGKTVALFSGIADPGSFEDLILGLGIKVTLHFKFPDHHRYIQEELNKIIRDSQDKDARAIITTEKDAARLEQLGLLTADAGIFVLRIELKITKDEEGFFNRLVRVYQP